MFRSLLVFLINFSVINFVQLTSEVNPQLSRIWGPGLTPEKIVMPARYFFVQAVDKNNNSITKSLKEPLQIVIDGATKDKRPCRIWTTILDRKDGSYIIRYKLYEACHYMKISVLYKNNHLSGSPYIINAIVYPDDCKCPLPNVDKLLSSWECGLVPTEISERLKIFDKISLKSFSTE